MLKSCCTMLLPEPLEKPLVTDGPLAVHEKVVPETLGEVLKAILVDPLLQNDWDDGVAVAVGIGLIVTVALP